MFRRISAPQISILTLSPASTLAAPVGPPTVGNILDPGGSISVTKTVHIPPSPDIPTVTSTNTGRSRLKIRPDD